MTVAVPGIRSMKTSKFSAASILILTLGVPFMAHSSVDWSWDWVEPTRSYTPYDTIIPLYTVTNNAGSTEPLRLAALLFDAGVSKVDGKSFKYAYQLVGGSLGRDSILPGQTVDLSVLGFMPNLRKVRPYRRFVDWSKIWKYFQLSNQLNSTSP